MVRVYFGSPEDMLRAIVEEDRDLYNTRTSEYVFNYNDKGSICRYWGMGEADARYLAKISLDNGNITWSTELGWRDNEVIDSNRWLVDNGGTANKKDAPLAWCRKNYRSRSWVLADGSYLEPDIFISVPYGNFLEECRKHTGEDVVFDERQKVFAIMHCDKNNSCLRSNKILFRSRVPDAEAFKKVLDDLDMGHSGF